MATTPIAQIPIVVTANLSQLEAALKNAQGVAASGGAQISSALQGGLDKAGTGAANLTSSLNGLTGSTNTVTSALSGVSPVALSAAGAITAMVGATTSAIAASVKLAASLEINTVAFSKMLGSTQAATEHLNKLRQFAIATPFEFPELLAASKRMQALGFSSQQVVPMLRSIGDAVAGIGGTTQTLDRVVLAISQIQSKGRVMGQEMNQLAESGIPAWEMLAKSIGVTIPQAMKMAEAGAISASTAIPALLAGMNAKFAGTMEAQSKTLTGMWRQVTESMQFALTDAGQAILPLMKSIMEAVTPLIQLVGDLAKHIDKLGYIPGIAVLREEVSFVSDGLGIFSAAVTRAVEEVGKLSSKNEDLARKTKDVEGPLDRVHSILRGLAATIRGIDMDPLNKGFERLQSLVGKDKDTLDALARSMGELSSGAKKVLEDQKAANKVYADATATYNELVAARQRGAATDADVTRALAAMQDAHKALTPELEKTTKAHKEAKMAARDFVDVLPMMGARFEVLQQEYDKLLKDHAKLELALERGQVGFFTMAESVDELNDPLKLTSEQIKKLENFLPPTTDAMADMNAETKALAAAYHELGMSSERDLAKLDAALKTIMADSQATGGMKLVANVNYWNAQVEEARKAGTQLPREQLIMLKRMEEQLRRSTEIQLGFWENLRDGAKDIFHNLGQDLTRGLIDVVKSLFTDDANKQLDEQAAALRQSLEERAADLAKFEAETQAKIAETTKKYDDSLAKEVADLRKSLADRRADYEKYAAEVSKKIADVTQSNRSDLARQVQAVRDSLRQQEQEYRQYVQDAAREEQRLRDETARQLQSALNDLRSNLEDRTAEYQRFTRDANDSLNEIGQSYYRDLERLNRDSNRKLEDENRSYQRDQISLSQQIREAEAAGDVQRTMELRNELAQRAQDHNITSQRIREDLQSQTDDIGRQAEEQRTALAKQLADAKQQYEQFAEDVSKKQQEVIETSQRQLSEQLADITAGLTEQTKALDQARADAETQIGELTAKYDADLQQQLADLRENLGERAAALEEYAQQVEDQIIEVTAKNREALAQEIADLNKSLAERRADYAAFVQDIKNQLAELEAAHKSALDRIGEMFKNVFAVAAEALAEFVGKYLVGQLITKLTDAIGLTQKLGQAIGTGVGVDQVAEAGHQAVEAIVGGTGAASKIAGGLGGGGGLMGAGAGGLMAGPVGAVAAALEIASSVVANVQFAHMNTALGRIEESTRYLKILTENLVDKALMYWPKLQDLSNFNNTFWAPQIAHIEMLLESIDGSLGIMAGQMPISQALNGGMPAFSLPTGPAMPESIMQAMGSSMLSNTTNYVTITAEVRTEADANSLITKLSTAMGKGGQT